MDWKTLLQAALTLVVGFALKWFFALVGFEIDPALLDTLVAAIVTFLLGLFFVNTGERAVMAYRARLK